MDSLSNQCAVLVLGHSLAAPENRTPFQTLPWPVNLCAPRIWRSPGNVTQMVTDSSDHLTALKVSMLGSNSLFVYIGLYQLMKSIRPRLVYLWEEPWSLAAFQILFLQKLFSFKIIFFTAENRRKKLPFPFRNICNSVYKKSVYAVVPTQEIAHRLQNDGYLGPIRPIPLWASHRPFIPLTNQLRIAFIGRLIPLKRLPLLIKALSLMPNVFLRLIGDGPQMKELQLLAQTLSLSSRIEFCGYLSNDQLEIALREVRLVALLTGENDGQAEQFGKSVLDAVLCGIPAIVAPTGNLTQWPLEFDTVRIARCETLEGLAADLMDALSHPPSAIVLQKAREKAQFEYGPAKASLRFTQLFKDTLEA
jgi:glycosyltransferase involved in cell wall biosynthesis